MRNIKTLIDAKRRREDAGFTLIELLVVVIIIGILAAIAIPAFLNQQKTAHDTAVEADLRNVATNIETLRTHNPNETRYTLAALNTQTGTPQIPSTSEDIRNASALRIWAGTDTNSSNYIDVTKTPGVNITLDPENTPGAYHIYANNPNAKQYHGTPGTNSNAHWDSTLGGLQKTPTYATYALGESPYEEPISQYDRRLVAWIRYVAEQLEELKTQHPEAQYFGIQTLRHDGNLQSAYGTGGNRIRLYALTVDRIPKSTYIIGRWNPVIDHTVISYIDIPSPPAHLGSLGGYWIDIHNHGNGHYSIYGNTNQNGGIPATKYFRGNTQTVAEYRVARYDSLKGDFHNEIYDYYGNVVE